LTGRVADFYSAGGVICGGACLLLADFLLSGFSIVSGYPIRYVTAYRLLPKQRGKFSPRAETIYMLGNAHDSTTIWRLWDADRKCVIQASNVRFDELADSSEPATNISDPFRIANTDAVASRQEDASQQADAMQTQADADTSRQHNASRVDNAKAYPPRILVDTGELRHTTTRYNLWKRPYSAAHRTWVEEESDSADPVSYQNSVKHPTLGLEWSEAVRKELHSLHLNNT